MHGAHVAYDDLVTSIGPSAAGQLEQPIRAPDAASIVITFGKAHAEHSNSKGEYVAPTQSTAPHMPSYPYSALDQQHMVYTSDEHRRQYYKP